ncbi:gamma-glutamyltransferase family protein [Oleiharenicola sp. Vm1]|uniref:gamma-glutamyltransferase family protein n=1 Tax=Oleiharenicola sp. Vm1 TaxID=3398393 RepID=UPI0039F631C0
MLRLLRRSFVPGLLFLVAALGAAAAVPVRVEPVTAPHGMVVAGHPEAAQAGVEVLKAGGNAIDAAVAVSLALGVAEPYGSGLGGKLMLLYHDAKSGRTYALDAMDAAPSVDVAAYVKRPDEVRSYGYGSVCVPGLAAGLALAHEKWGRLKWADDVAPSIRLAREGFTILPKTRDFFAEQEKKLRRGDAEIARLYLPGGELPAVGTRLANADLAHTLELVAAHGRDGFYRGPVAAAIVAASARGGGAITLDDLAHYEARVSEPLTLDFRGYRLLAAPPPASGPALFLTILKVLEDQDFGGGPLRRADNLDLLGRTWRVVSPLVYRDIADAPQAWFNFEKLVAPDSIAALRAQVRAARPAPAKSAAWLDDGGFSSDTAAATTHFAVADAEGNFVCATQSQSLHFGAGVVPPGTGVVMNDSMSNFSFSEPRSLNYLAPGRRSRSTISPLLAFRDGRAVFAMGIPGAARIPTAMLQALLDHIVLRRSFADAIGDTRVHWDNNWRRGDDDTVEAERSLPESEVVALRALGWKVDRSEAPGTGRRFGGINVIERHPDGSYTGYADPRRTNAAVGY